jgi:hypothetical protein
MNVRRSIINSDIIKLADNFLNNDLSEEKKDSYFGKVVNNLDPLFKGRCQIRVLTIFDSSISDGDLPWAIPDFGFVGGKKGSFVVPSKDTVVKVYFDHGDIYCPVYTAKGLEDSNLPTRKNNNYPANKILYTTDNGDYYEINTFDKKTTLHHSSGAEITIDITGKVSIKANFVEVQNESGAIVTPNPLGGPFNCLPFCPFTGMPHQGKMVANSPPLIP